MVETQQQYCLKWNNYQTSLTSTFKDLLACENFVDCTLSCGQGQGGQTINAHRVVLSACSPYFRQVLSNLGAWQHPVIILKDIKYEDLTGIVEFIYHGEVSIDQDCLPGFLQAAESLRIKGLTEDSNKEKDAEKPSIDQKTGRKGEKTTLIQKALEKLLNGSNEISNEPTPPPEEEHENNNEQKMVSMEQHAAMMAIEGEDEEEALSESEIRESNLKSLDFQTMYQNFMSGATSEDSEGGKDNTAPNLNEDGSLNFNFGDANNSLESGKKTCPFCFQQLSWHALSRHIRDMHRAKSDLVTCKYCMKTFRNKNSLGCHIWRFHKRGKELIGKDHSFDG